MIRSIRTLCAAAIALLAFSGATARAEDAPALGGVRGDIVANMNDAGRKVIELAGAVPAGKWSWRPGRGVRSIGEVYLHVAQGNYLLGAMLGTPSPVSPDVLQHMDTTPQTAEKTVQMIKDSYAFAQQAITAVPDADLGTTVSFFGRPMSKQAVMLALASHSHEHLGQSIAYARSVGVVPPWTAREQAAAKKAADAKKAEGAEHTHSH